MSDADPTATIPGPATAVHDRADDGEGLRERKKKLTRHAIHAAALSLVAERGLDGVTTEEIAGAAGVSTRTFFNYFPTKDAAVLGMAPDLPQMLAEALVARPASEDLFTALTGVLTHWSRQIEADPLRNRRRLVLRRDPRLAAALLGANRDLELALAEAAIGRPDRPGDLQARVTVAAVLGATRACYAGERSHAVTDDAAPPTRSFAARLVEAFALLGDGLARQEQAPVGETAPPAP